MMKFTVSILLAVTMLSAGTDAFAQRPAAITSIKLQAPSGTNALTLGGPVGGFSASYSLFFPAAAPGPGALPYLTNGSGQLGWLAASTNGFVLTQAGGVPIWAAISAPFSAITSGTNTLQALLVGNGSSLAATGTGTIDATTLLTKTWSAPDPIGLTTPNSGAFTTLSATGLATLSGGTTLTGALNVNGTTSTVNGQVLTVVAGIPQWAAAGGAFGGVTYGPSATQNTATPATLFLFDVAYNVLAPGNAAGARIASTPLAGVTTGSTSQGLTVSATGGAGTLGVGGTATGTTITATGGAGSAGNAGGAATGLNVTAIAGSGNAPATVTGLTVSASGGTTNTAISVTAGNTSLTTLSTSGLANTNGGIANTGTITSTGNISTSGIGTITSAGLLTASNALTVTSGSIVTPLVSGVIHSSGTGTALTSSPVVLTSEVSGILPIANGGTGSATVAGVNQFFANTTAGSAPAFRSLVTADLPAGTGTVTSVSVTTANGVSGAVANPTTTPAITLTLGAITPSSVAATGTVTGSNLSGTNTGDQTITLTGDVTGSGTGSFAATIGTDKVVTAKILNSNVTLAKIANIAANSFLGNNTAGAATPIELTVAQAKTMLAITGSNSGDVALAGENYLSIAGQVITANPVNLSGTNATGILAAGRFPALTGDVTTTAGSLATTIAPNAVTYAKMQAVSATSKLLGSSSTATAVQEITIGSGLTLSGTTLSTSGGGTVTSVGLALPSIFTVSGSPVTISGTLTGTLATQAANLIFAGPGSGVAAAPTFRSLVTADLPAGTGTVTSVGLTVPGVIFTSPVSGSPVTTSGTFALALNTQTANSVLAGPSSGAAATPTFRSLVAADLPAGIGTVTTVSVTTANGVSGVVATPTTTPAITLTLGAITPSSVAATGAVSGTTLTATNTTNQLILGTTNTTTISSVAPTTSRTYTIPDAGGNTNFIMGTSGVAAGQTITNATASGTALSVTNTGIGTTSTGLSVSVSGAATTNNAITVSASGATTNNAINVTAGNVTLSGSAQQLSFKGTSTGVSTFAAGAQGATNLTYTLPITAPTAGQVLSSTAAGVMSWSSSGSEAAYAVFAGNSLNNPGVGDFMFLGTSSTGVENKTQWLVTRAGTLRNLYMNLTVAPGVGSSRTMTVNKNGVATALLVTITGAVATGNNTANAITVAAGDLISIQSTVGVAPLASIVMWSFEFGP